MQKILRQAGYEVIAVSDLSHGISDMEVINKAKTGELVILTFDKDYGEIRFKHSQENHPLLFFLDSKEKTLKQQRKMVISLLQHKDIGVENKFTVIEKEGIRQRAYSKE